MKFSFLQALFLYKRWKCSSVSRSPWPRAWFKVFNEQSHRHWKTGCPILNLYHCCILYQFPLAFKSVHILVAWQVKNWKRRIPKVHFSVESKHTSDLWEDLKNIRWKPEKFWAFQLQRPQILCAAVNGPSVHAGCLRSAVAAFHWWSLQGLINLF